MIDGAGHIETESNLISDEWFARGCIVNHAGWSGLPGSFAEVNTNAFYEAARRMSRWVRIVSPLQIVGYAVENGKSVLWFRRYSVLRPENDLFGGITGEIAHEAPPGGWTNEWLMDVWLKNWNPNDSSEWKLESYGYYWAISDRCTLGEPKLALPTQGEWLWHIAYGQRAAGYGNLLAETAPGYRYGKLADTVRWMNQPSGGLCSGDPTCVNFYKSCRIYEPPAEVDSAEAVLENGIELVRITLTSRLRSTYGETGGAPGSISRDMSTWDRATISAEPFRTPENAIRLWLLARDNADYDNVLVPGDKARNSSLTDIYAAIVPHFYFVKLIPKPYEDENDTQDVSDTPLWSDSWAQIDFTLRAMCEGFVDEQATLEMNQCTVSGVDCIDLGHDLYDYTYESLCYQAFGGRWLGLMPTEATDETDETETRSPDPMGFGPLPNTRACAEVFNRAAAAVDLLTKARVMLPGQTTCNYHTYYPAAPKPVDYVTEGICGSTSCGATWKIAVNSTAPAATEWDSSTGPTDCTSTAIWARTIGVISCDGAGNYSLSSQRITVDYRWSFTDPEAEYAVPESWRDMLPTCLGGMFCLREESITYQATPSGTTECGHLSWVFSCDIQPVILQQTGRCVMMTNGTLDCGAQPNGGVHFDGHTYIGVPIVCGAGPERSIEAVPLSTRALYIDIPVV